MNQVSHGKKESVEKSPAHRMKEESREDYLKAIYLFSEMCGRKIRLAELAKYMQFSKPSVSRMLGVLRDEGMLMVGDDHLIGLTEKGEEKARSVYEKHCFFREKLVKAGVDTSLAGKEACRLEHAISDESFRKVRTYWDYINRNI